MDREHLIEGEGVILKVFSNFVSAKCTKKRDNFKLDAGRLRKKGAVKSTDLKLCLFIIEFKFVRKRERFYGHDVLSRYLALSDSRRCSSSRKRRHISLTRSSGNQTVIS